MNNDEDIFEDLDDEIVSSNEMEEQSNDVPSNSNKRNNFANNIKSARDFEKNNKGTIERLNSAKNKNRMPNSTGIGKEIGNKIAGKSEEEKSNLEKGADQVGGAATGAAITAATGGAINGKLAGELGDAAFQVAKKKYSTKFKIYLFVGIAFISLIFIIIIAMNSDDIDYSESNNVDSYVTSGMTDDELLEYLEYSDICPNKTILESSGLLDEINNIIDNDLEDLEVDTENTFGINNVCAYAISYFKRIKKTYNKFKESCNVELTTKKDINNPCDVTLNIPLLHESLSYGKANNELWNQKATPNQKKDIKDISNAMVEYVHEYCYVDVGKYKDKNGTEHIGSCEECTYIGPWYQNREWYYFQLSFDKYVSFLKYGTTSTHPYYTGENNGEVELGTKEKNTSINGQTGLYDHKCVGPNDSTFNYNNSSNLSSSNNSSSTIKIDADSSKYCSEVFCESMKNSGTAHTECVKGCKNIQNKCKIETCKNISSYSTSAYRACMNECIK